MDAVLNTLLPFVLPPLVGALIGYITNYIAIRMLFRPLTEKRFLGVKLPLTPGIIPKRRYELAESIGRMVSRELLTEDTVLSRVRSENFKKSVKGGISNLTTNILNTPMKHLLPDSSSSALLSEDFFRFINGFFFSEAFSLIFKDVIANTVRHLFSSELKTLFTHMPDKERMISAILETMSSEEMRDKFLLWLNSTLKRHADDNTKIGKFLPVEGVETLCELLEDLYPHLFGSFIGWLRKNSTREELEIRGRFLLRDILDKLTVFQKIIVSAGQYDRTLDERMPEIVNDAILALEEAGENSDNRVKIIQAVRNGLLMWREKPLAELSDNFREKLYNLVERILYKISEPSVRKQLQEGLLKLIISQENRKLGEIIKNLLNMSEEEASEYLYRLITDLFYGSHIQNRDEFYRRIKLFITSQGEVTLGSFIGINTKVKEDVELYLSERITALLEKKIPDILESFDVNRLVIERINNLDIKSVERLLLIVIEKHLKWINLFGAFLGSLIGALQIVINKVF